MTERGKHCITSKTFDMLKITEELCSGEIDIPVLNEIVPC
jgi:hypothetical protein